MKRNSVLLSIGPALVLSLFAVDVSHAVHIDRAKQSSPTRIEGIVNATAKAPATQVASAPIPCRGDGMRRTGAPCTKQSLPGGAAATSGTLYTMMTVTASVILTLAFVLLSVFLYRRTQHPLLVKSTH